MYIYIYNQTIVKFESKWASEWETLPKSRPQERCCCPTRSYITIVLSQTCHFSHCRSNYWYRSQCYRKFFKGVGASGDLTSCWSIDAFCFLRVTRCTVIFLKIHYSIFCINELFLFFTRKTEAGMLER